MSFKQLMFLTAKTFLMTCLILLSMIVFLSWNNKPFVPDREYVGLERIYKPTTHNEDKEFYIREEITFLSKELDVQDFYSDVANNRFISNIILEEAKRQNIPINLVFAIAKVESNFNPKAINHNHSSSDYGLFQLNNSYRDWTNSEFFDIKKNTQEGIRYLKEMLILFNGDVLKAAAAYNAGPQRVIDNRIPKSTERYITKVLATEDELNIKFNDYLSKDSIVLNIRSIDELKE